MSEIVNGSYWTAPQCTSRAVYGKLMDIMWKQISKNLPHILNGKMTSIDPGSARCGWAHFRNGQLKKSGEVHTKTKNLPERCRILGDQLAKVPPANVMVCEYIHDANVKTNMKIYRKLIQAVGAVHASTRREYTMEIAPIIWQGIMTGYTKGTDEEDAIAIGQVIHHMAWKSLQGEWLDLLNFPEDWT